MTAPRGAAGAAPDDSDDDAAGPAAGAAAAGAAASTRAPVIKDDEEAPSTFDYESPFLPPFTAAADAQLLAQALAVTGGKKDLKLLIDILTTRKPAQVQAARAVFDRVNEKPLLKWISKRTRFNLKSVLMALARSPAEFDAKAMHDAINGIGTDETILLDVLCFRDNAQIGAIKAAYTAEFGSNLESDIRGDTSGDFARLMCALLAANRPDELDPLDQAAVEADARDFFAATEAKTFGTNDELIIRMFARRSNAHLRAVAIFFGRNLSKRIHRHGQEATHHFEATLKDETSGVYQRALLALLFPQKLTADIVHRAIDGVGTKDKFLIETLVSAHFNPLRLFLAKHAYKRIYGRAMVADVERDTAGLYRRAMRRLCCTHQGNLLAAMLRENLWDPLLWTGSSNKKKISHIVTLGGENARERSDTADAYFLDYGVKLSKAFKSSLASDHAKFLIALTTQRAQSDAQAMRRAMRGFGTSEKVLIDILTTRRAFEIERLKKAYEDTYHRTLSEAISGDVSGHFRDGLLVLCEGRRPAERTIDAGQADIYANRLYEAGENKTFGTNDSEFQTICTTLSSQDLEMVDAAYMRLRSKSLETVITKQTSGNFRQLLLACVNPAKYIAFLLRKTMKGLGTDDSELVRLLVHRPRAEIDAIKVAFQAEYKKSLGQWIVGDTSGHYRRALLSYIGEEALLDSATKEPEEAEAESADGKGGSEDSAEA